MNNFSKNKNNKNKKSATLTNTYNGIVVSTRIQAMYGIYRITEIISICLSSRLRLLQSLTT